MATWVIGDVHGCWRELRELLATIGWPASGDRLWLVGDLVNRGPASLDVLRWAADHDHRVVTVLGNHELYLLARAAGLPRRKRSDTLDPVLEAPDAGQLLAWLRHRPLLHREGRYLLVHAGLWPAWNEADAAAAARIAEAAIRSGAAPEELARIAAGPPPPWPPPGGGRGRALAAAAILTGLRAVGPDGTPHPGAGPLEALPRGATPWFSHSRAVREGATVVFGHWSRLGLRLGPGTVALDAGCVHGGSLAAVRLEDRRVVRVAAQPGSGLVSRWPVSRPVRGPGHGPGHGPR